MKLFLPKRHAVDFLFPVTLFFVFTISALTIILMASRIYQTTVQDSQRNFSSDTVLSYVMEKMHQNDRKDGISIDQLDGCCALVFEQEISGTSYLTYLYAWDGQLRELYVKEGTTFSLASGKSILPIQTFTVEETDDQVLTFSCTDLSGFTSSMNYTIRSIQ